MAIRFNAPSDRVYYIGPGLPNPADGWTFTAWIKVSVDTNYFATFARFSSSGSTTATLATTENGTGGPIYATVGGILTALAGMTVDVWYRFAVTCVGTSGILYTAEDISGPTMVQSGSVAGASSPDQVCFGGRSETDLTESLDGVVAYPKLWSGVLTQSQIEAEWLSASPVMSTGVSAFWPLTAEDLTDHSGNGLDLIAGSTPVTTVDDPPIPQPSNVRVYNGSVWNDALVRTYNGSVWNDASVRTYNGSVWV